MRKNRKMMNRSFVQFGRHGRLMKNTEGAGGGTSGGGDNNAGNAGGNGGESGNSGGDSNNNGAAFDGSSFWGGSAQDGNAAPNGESAGGSGSESGDGSSDGGNVGQALTQQLQSMSFGDPIFTNEVAEQINNGDFNGVQQRFDAMGQNIVRQSLSMVVQILKPFAQQMQDQMRDEFSSTLTNRDNNDTLVKDFPAAKDPRVAPMIRQVFNQALQNNRGNREAAVSQTKEMIALMSGITAGDLNLNVAPRGPDDNGRPANPTVNWLDELTSR